MPCMSHNRYHACHIVDAIVDAGMSHASSCKRLPATVSYYILIFHSLHTPWSQSFLSFMSCSHTRLSIYIYGLKCLLFYCKKLKHGCNLATNWQVGIKCRTAFMNGNYKFYRDPNLIKGLLSNPQDAIDLRLWSWPWMELLMWLPW